MKQLSFLFILSIISFLSFSQNSIPVRNPSNAEEKSGWNLEKYVWSHTHYKTGGNDKPVIDFDAIDNWPGVGSNVSISPDGKYFAFNVENGTGLPSYLRKADSLIIQSIANSWRIAFSGVKPGFFSPDSKQYIFLDKQGLYFLPLGHKQPQMIKDVISYKVPPNSKNGWLAYQLKGSEIIILKNLSTWKEKSFIGQYKYSFDNSGQWLILYSNKTKELQLYNLFTEKDLHFSSVASYLLNEAGKTVLVKNETGELSFTNLGTSKTSELWHPENSTQTIKDFNQDASGSQVVFSLEDQKKGNSIWYWKEGTDKAVMKIDGQTKGISELILQPSASFIDNGRYIQFFLQPLGDLRKPQTDAVQLDVWSYKDKILQSAQPYLSKTPLIYSAIFNLYTNQIIQLENSLIKINESAVDISGDFVIARKKNDIVNGNRFWEKDYYKDSTWLVSLSDGKRQFLPARGFDNSFSFSPDGKYLVYFDEEQGCHFFSYDLSTGINRKISIGIPDGQLGLKKPFLRPAEQTGWNWGVAAWLEGDKGVLVYDNYDIWQLDLTGRKPAVNITNGYGALHKTVLCWVGAEHHRGSRSTIKEGESLLLKAFNIENKNSGYYLKSLGKPGNPELLYIGPYYFQFFESYAVPGLNREQMGMRPLKADNSNTWLVQRQTTTESPNYFVTKDFKNYKQLTFYQPQKNYNWLTSELVSFKQIDGSLTQGVLYKPQNFDSSKKYPVIVSLYGQLSDQLYQYPAPGYIESPNIYDRPSWLVSHGYLVLVVDIYFDKGKWGPSALNTVDGAAKYLNGLSFVDGEKIGLTGHSNSGLWGYYILTHSKFFAALVVGAAVTNVTSAAFKVNNEGKSNIERTEDKQFGTGLGKFWDNKEVWLDHTTVLNADQATCPLLMFHNDGDGISLDHPISMFISLQRLEKPVWWLEYNEGKHTLVKIRDLRDFTIRYTQYFDHYIKGGPAPSWMTKGIPYFLKGIENRYDFDLSGQCNVNCKVCKKIKLEEDK
jgi:dienelactone hydrolase